MPDFKFYTVEDVDNTRFYQMPKILFEDERFIDLSDSAKILYSILRDRTDLSKKNNWIDEQGRIYIIFTIKEIMEKMRWGNKKAGKILQELQDFGLIQKYRETRTSAYRIYVMNLCTDATCQNDTSGRVKTTSREVSKRHPNDTNNNSDTKSVIYSRQKKPGFNDFNQRSYNFDELEDAIINRFIDWSDTG